MIKKLIFLLSMTLIFYGVLLTVEVTDTPASYLEKEISIESVWQEGQEGDEVSLSLFGRGFSSDMRVFLKDQNQDHSLSTKIPSWGLTLDMKISGNYLYIANNLNGFSIVDISDPMEPEILTSVQTGKRCWNIEVSGDYLYSLTPYNPNAEPGIEIYDISNKNEPFLVNSLSGKEFGVTFKVDQNNLYVPVDDSLIMYDITTISDIREIATVKVAPNITFVKIKNDTLYVATSSDGLFEIDLSTPNSLTCSRLINTVNPAGLVVSNYIYFVGSNNQLIVFDLRGAKLDSINLPSSSLKMTSNGSDGVYLSLLNFGVQSYQYDGKTIRVGNSANYPKIGKQFETYDSYCYAANLLDSVVDVIRFDPGQDFDFDSFVQTGSKNIDFFEDGDDGYVGSESLGYKKVDLITGVMSDLQVANNPKYLYSDNDILFSYNKYGIYTYREESDGSVAPVASLAFKSSPMNLESYNSYLYLLSRNEGIRIVKYSSDGELFEAGNLTDIGTTFRVSIFNEYLVVSKGQKGLDIYSLKDPERPTKISSYQFPSPYAGFAAAWETRYHEGVLYIASGYDGVFVLSVADPSNPFLMNILSTQGYVKHIQIENDLLYIAEFNNGLSIYSLHTNNPPTFIENFTYPRIHKFWVLDSGKILIGLWQGFRLVNPLKEVVDFYPISENKVLLNISSSDLGSELNVVATKNKSVSSFTSMPTVLAQN